MSSRGSPKLTLLLRYDEDFYIQCLVNIQNTNVAPLLRCEEIQTVECRIYRTGRLVANTGTVFTISVRTECLFELTPYVSGFSFIKC
jgi:hypothetical protein